MKKIKPIKYFKNSDEINEVLDTLEAEYPDAGCALHHDSIFHLLLAVVLSAQTTDASVNTVTPELFSTYHEPADLSAADINDVEGAVVTAFGTGAEMNCGAVITHEEKNLKNGVMGAFYDFAILDPEYTMTMPMNQVISGAFDSLSHSMETYMGSPREVNYSDEINEATQRNIIRNIRATLIDPADRQARSELVWAAAMAENGILKLGKVTDFQCHMLEHQLGAYTDCNHGLGLAVLHPVLYRHMMPEANRQFARLAAEVWGVSPDGKSEAELAESFITALSDFIKEIGLPTTLAEMGIADVDLEAIAKSTIRTDGCVKKFTDEELLAVLKECI